jgi:lysophospholipase L1-like esterase
MMAWGQATFILVGDSTVAPGNGWGPGFCDLLTKEASCVNLAKNGRSSSSFRAEGLWDQALKEMKAPGEKYVLIQFGHNDQPGKPGRSTDLATEFPANMRGYVEEARAAGATPVLITPLTRRMFRAGKLSDNLGPWAASTMKVGAETGAPVLPLNAESAATVQKMGPAEANTLAVEPPPSSIAEAASGPDSPEAPKEGTQFDYTHLGPKGSAVFGRMVAEELVRAIPALRNKLKL